MYRYLQHAICFDSGMTLPGRSIVSLAATTPCRLQLCTVLGSLDIHCICNNTRTAISVMRTADWGAMGTAVRGVMGTADWGVMGTAVWGVMGTADCGVMGTAVWGVISRVHNLDHRYTITVAYCSTVNAPKRNIRCSNL